MSSPSSREERRRRRELLKAHHPDLGGDPEEFLRVTATVPRPGSGTPWAGSPAGDEVRFARRPRGLARVRALLLRTRRRRRPPRVV